MKKLLFAFAGTAAFAAFAADPAAGANDISLVGFENYTADERVLGKGDDGQDGGTLWSCAGDDASLVKTYGGDNATAPSITEPRPFAGETNTKYLALDTNGSELQRAIPNGGTSVTADGTYIDTLVQFTPSETAPTAADLTGAKLAIWLGVDSVNNTTNLYVQGGYMVGDVGDPSVVQPTMNANDMRAYKLSNVQVVAGEWHRLTVKAIELDNNSNSVIAGFQIFIDGTLAVSDTAVCDSNAVDYFTGWAEYVYPGAAGLLTDKKVIPSCEGVIQNAATLTSVGFKGTGALDDFVVTREAPVFGPAGIDFTLTWGAGYTAVSYTIDGGAAVSLSGETSPFAVPGLVGGEAITFTFTNADGATKTMNATAADDGDIDADDAVFTWADYLGEAVAGAYEIDDLAELILFQKGVAAGLETASTTFKLTDDVTLATAWPGVGIQNGKDLACGTNEANFVSKEYHIAEYDAGAFKGAFDGQNHTISGFQMQGGNLDYCGFFNSIKDATIQNLKIAYKENKFATDSSNSTSESGATFVGVAKSSTLQNLTTIAGSVTDVTCAKGFGGIVGYHMAGTTVESCTNNINLTSAKSNKAGGISMITQGGTGAAIVRNCQNNGTTAGNANQKGGVVGYVCAATTIENCTVTANSDPTFLHNEKQTVTIQGTNKAPAGVRPYTYTNNKVAGLNFATVDNGVATFVADNALALNGEYKVMATGATATYEFAAAGSISFDTNLIQAVTFAITAPGLDLTDATANGVVTFTAAAQGTELEPGEQDSTVYTTQADAEAALANVTIVEPEDVSTNTTISAADKEAYDALFEAKVVEVAGGYAIEVGLKAQAEAALQGQADDNAAEIVDAINDSEVTFDTTPGLYYSIKWGTTLSMDQQTEKVLATGSTLTLDLPKGVGATTGFYKVMIDVTK